MSSIHSGCTIWFTGLSGSGKSTLSTLLAEHLRRHGARVQVLDGDVVRTELCRGLGFSKADREENIRRVGFVCELLARNGVIAIAAVISPYRSGRDEVRSRISCFAPEQVAAGLLEPDAMDIDVHALHQGFLRGLRARGGGLRCDAEVRALAHDGRRWQVDCAAGRFAAPLVVNAAGAWADEIGRLAGAAPIGLVPKRRTAITFDPPAGVAIDRWPAVIDIDEQWYFKPEAGRLLASPADETPSPPCDAQPDEYDVAVLVDRLAAATTLVVPRIHSRWAGLRSFVADKTIVAGFDASVPGLFWLAGQGGYGIQTSPAVARAAAALLRGERLPQDIAALGVQAAALSPQRPLLRELKSSAGG